MFDISFLNDLRRQFNWTSPAADPALPANRQMLLMTRVISTETPPATDQDSGFWAHPSRRGTIPFLIQFDGEVTDGWKETLRQTGGIMHHYMPNNGWLVELTPETREKVADLSMVRWVSAFEPADKIQPFLKQLMVLYPNDFHRLNVNVLSLSADDTTPIRDWLTVKGMTVYGADPGVMGGGMIKASMTLGTIGDLAMRGDVQWIEEDVGKGLHNNLAALPNHMNTASAWHTYQLTGKGQIVGHADTGLDIGTTNEIHPDFAGRVLAGFALGRPETWSDADAHGTHTAGSIVGNGAMSDGLYRGTAWEASIVHQSVEDSDGYLSGIPSNLTELFLPTHQLGARVHSDSWGSSVNGVYTYDSLSADDFMWNHPDMLLVFSAGNDGIDLYPANGVVDLDSMGAPGTAKNLLTVGAMESDRSSGGYGATHTWGYAWPSDYPANPIRSDLISVSATNSPYAQGMAAFSSRGPTDDGRIKPDVVASGTDIISCRSAAATGAGWGVMGGNNQYLYNGGTSMSCPLTAGAVLLVRQYLVERAGITNPSAALLKAMMVSGAKSMAPGQYGTSSTQEIPSASPNMVEGFGQVDVGRSVYPTGLSVRVIDTQSLGLHDTSNFVFTVTTPGQPLSVALVWTDYPGAIQAGVKLVNDYDVTLTGPGISVLYPNGLAVADHVNPVEVIRMSQAEAGDYTIHVNGYNIPQSAGRYALVIRAAMDQKPDLLHDPLPPVLPTNLACAVSAVLTYYLPLTNGELNLYWTTNGPSGPFVPVPFGWQDGHSYTSEIPAQPVGMVAHYYLAGTVSTYAVQYPTNAPDSVRQVVFGNPAVTMQVEGSRTNSVVVDPVYGTYTYPSGTWVHATARPICYSNDTRRFVASVWHGTGISPTNGVGSMAEFTLLANGVLTWDWQEEVMLTQNSQPAGAVNRKTWPFINSSVTTETVWPFASDGVTFYGFAGWKVDGVLWTNNQGQAANPVTGLIMSQPRTATAWYIPYTTDSNGNGLFDWWEYRYSGFLGALVQNLDNDGDNWFNYYENLDDTDPWNPASFPTAPVISLAPMTLLQTGAPPWTITAVITDNFSVVEAFVTWSANGGPEQTRTMSYMGGDIYQTQLDPGLKTPVTILFRVHAADFVFETITPMQQLVSHYPIMRASPTNFNTIRLPRTGYVQSAQVANDGTTTLNWNALVLAPVLMDDVEQGTNGWENTAWHVSKLRSSSPSNSWYCGSDSTRLYGASMDAWLVSPPVTLGEGAVMSFRHWMRAECDSGDYYYDAGLVRISTDNGQTYEDITPVGGYPHRMVASSGTPFAPGTPCFGSNDWIESIFDLSPWLGSPVRIAFVFGSDSGVEKEGWYIDDVWIGSESIHPWLTLTGTVTAATPSGGSTNSFALKADSLAFAPQANVRGAIRLDHNGVGSGLNLLPFQLRRPAYISASSSDLNGTISPLYADLLDNETTSFVTRASSGSRIKSLTTNGIPVSTVFGIGSTNHVLALTHPLEDIVIRARFANVWMVTLSVQGPGLATPAGVIQMDEGTSTSVLFQAQADNRIWNLVADGSAVTGAGGLTQYTWPVMSISTHHVAQASFGPAVLTNTPNAVTADWMRQHYPQALDFDTLAMLDTDGDGMVGWKEFACLTDPTDAESLLRIIRPPELSADVLQATLHVQTVSGLTYQAQSAYAPTGSWTSIGDIVTATGGVTQLPATLLPGDHKGFFRVLVLP